jgi:hypothetical protein
MADSGVVNLDDLDDLDDLFAEGLQEEEEAAAAAAAAAAAGGAAAPAQPGQQDQLPPLPPLSALSPQQRQDRQDGQWGGAALSPGRQPSLLQPQQQQQRLQLWPAAEAALGATAEEPIWTPPVPPSPTPVSRKQAAVVTAAASAAAATAAPPGILAQGPASSADEAGAGAGEAVITASEADAITFRALQLSEAAWPPETLHERGLALEAAESWAVVESFAVSVMIYPAPHLSPAPLNGFLTVGMNGWCRVAPRTRRRSCSRWSGRDGRRCGTRRRRTFTTTTARRAAPSGRGRSSRPAVMMIWPTRRRRRRRSLPSRRRLRPVPPPRLRPVAATCRCRAKRRRRRRLTAHTRSALPAAAPWASCCHP